mgnify:CR=1 FL=1|jgi:hypothetical protein
MSAEAYEEDHKRNSSPSHRLSFVYTDDSWMNDAKCREHDPEIFFPEKQSEQALRLAKTICMQCDVRIECADYALETATPFGVWGGLSEEERRRILRRRYTSNRNNPL